MIQSPDTVPAAARSRAITSLVAGVASGALTLIDPAALKPSTRAGLYLGSGAIAGTLVWIGTGASEGIKDSKRFRLSIAVGLAAVSAAGTKLGFVIDSGIHQALLRRGVGNPRPVMAVGAGLLALAMALLEPQPKGREVEATGEGTAETAGVEQDLE